MSSDHTLHSNHDLYDCGVDEFSSRHTATDRTAARMDEAVAVISVRSRTGKWDDICKIWGPVGLPSFSYGYASREIRIILAHALAGRRGAGKVDLFRFFAAFAPYTRTRRALFQFLTSRACPEPDRGGSSRGEPRQSRTLGRGPLFDVCVARARAEA